MAEAKRKTTAELNTEAMKRMDEAKPVPSQEEADLATGASKELLAKQAEERNKNNAEATKRMETPPLSPLFEGLDEATKARNAEAEQRMSSSVPTPSQADLDTFVQCWGKTVEEIAEITAPPDSGIDPSKKTATAGGGSANYRTRTVTPE